jgi:hypothetical protein
MFDVMPLLDPSLIVAPCDAPLCKVRNNWSRYRSTPKRELWTDYRALPPRVCSRCNQSVMARLRNLVGSLLEFKTASLISIIRAVDDHRIPKSPLASFTLID